MERKKRVSVGVVLMGFFLLVVMLAGVAGLIAHDVLLRETTVGMSSDRETFSVIGALHILLEIGFKNGNTWVSILSASARDYIAIGLMTTGILLFIIAGFTKNHIMYLIAMLMTGASVFMKRLLTLITNPGFLFRQVGGGTLGLFGTVRLIMELMLVTAWILLLVVWLLSIIKTGKVKRGTGNPDKSLVIGFIPGLLMILAYLGMVGLGTRFMPKYLSMGPLLERSTEAAFVVSSALPPPNPIRMSALNFLAASEHALMESMLGSSSAFAKSCHSIPPSVRASSSGFCTPSFASPGSVTIKAREHLRFLISPATCLMDPLP